MTVAIPFIRLSFNAPVNCFPSKFHNWICLSCKIQLIGLLSSWLIINSHRIILLNLHVNRRLWHYDTVMKPFKNHYRNHIDSLKSKKEVLWIFLLLHKIMDILQAFNISHRYRFKGGGAGAYSMRYAQSTMKRSE